MRKLSLILIGAVITSMLTFSLGAVAGACGIYIDIVPCGIAAMAP